MADDHAATAVSAYGSRLAGVFRTPNIDELADEGARFANAVCTNAICTPSSVVMVTGLLSHVSGVRTLSDALHPAIPTYPGTLRPAGYRTAVIGKWHLHSEPQGFDHYEIVPAHGSYRNPRQPPRATRLTRPLRADPALGGPRRGSPVSRGRQADGRDLDRHTNHPLTNP